MVNFNLLKMLRNFLRVRKFGTSTTDIFTNKYKYELEIKSVLTKMQRAIHLIPEEERKKRVEGDL